MASCLRISLGRTRKAARPSSDIDIAVLMPYDTPRAAFFDRRLSLTNELMDLLRKNEIDVVVLNEATALLAYQILTKGRILYEDPRTHPRAGFTVRVVKQYIDTEHFRRLSLKYLNDSMAQYCRQRPAVALRERPNDRS